MENKEPIQKKSKISRPTTQNDYSSSFETPSSIPKPPVNVMRANPFERPNGFVFGATLLKPTMNPNFNEVRSMQFNPTNSFPDMKPNFNSFGLSQSNSDQQNDILSTPHKPILTLEPSPVIELNIKKTRSKK